MGVAEIASAIYGAWYLDSRAEIVPGRPSDDRPVGESEPSDWQGAGSRDDLSGVLRASHAGSTTYSRGWVVLAVLDGGGCLVGRDREQRVVPIGSYVNLNRPGIPIAPGEEAAISRLVDRVDYETRWWGTRSELGEPAQPLGRHYLHPCVPGVAGVVHGITSLLLDADFPWSLKLPIDPLAWRRPDALVVYAECAQSAQVRAALAEVASAQSRFMQPHLPPLTEPIGELISYAEDPGGDHSFGSHICAALAPGVLGLASAGAAMADPLAVLADALAASGVDPTRPWLRSPDA
ncbi:MAG: T3SS effector HopA1 family protein [Candidatus Nanopelagicales bacterium]